MKILTLVENINYLLTGNLIPGSMVIKFSIIQIAGMAATLQLFISGIYFIQTYKKNALGNIILALLMFSYATLIICSLLLTTKLSIPFLK